MARSRIGASSAAAIAPSRPERRRAAVVLGQQRHHLVGPVARALLDERADLEVLPRAHGLGQHPVGHVADQHVLEGELALAGEPALGAGGEDVLLLEHGERSPELPALRLGQRRQRGLPERSPHHGGLLHEAPLEGVEGIEARGQHGLHGVGQLGGAEVALGHPARHLLREERVPAGALHDLRPPRRRHRGSARPPARACTRRPADRGAAAWPSGAPPPSRDAGRAARRARGRRA